jgi:excisionase family DNA binding protein
MVREYYSIPEAAALLGISRIAVFKRVKKGQLPALRFGRNWAVPASALESALPAELRSPASEVQAALPAPANRPAALPAVPAQKEREAVEPLSSSDDEMNSMGWD